MKFFIFALSLLCVAACSFVAFQYAGIYGLWHGLTIAWAFSAILWSITSGLWLKMAIDD